MKCEICGKDILKDSQCIDYKYYHNDCIINLIKENQELKKQLEENKLNHKQLKDLDKIEKSFIEIKNQQKEFIEWLKNGINQVRNTEFLDERIQRAGLVAYNRVLSKYKKIIGIDIYE